jgi:hypothetical protein
MDPLLFNQIVETVASTTVAVAVPILVPLGVKIFVAGWALGYTSLMVGNYFERKYWGIKP